MHILLLLFLAHFSPHWKCSVNSRSNNSTSSFWSCLFPLWLENNLWNSSRLLGKATLPHQVFIQWFKHPWSVACPPRFFFYVNKNGKPYPSYAHMYFDLASVFASNSIPRVLSALNRTEIQKDWIIYPRRTHLECPESNTGTCMS